MIQLGGSGFALCFWHQLGRMDRNQALILLLQSQSDVWVMSSLRRAIELRSADATVKLTDRAVLEAAADLIASGELVLVRTRDRATGRTGDTSLGKGQSKSGSAPPPPPPNQVSQRSSPPPAEEPKVFPANVDAAAMAAAMQSAAQSGAPFCEH